MDPTTIEHNFKYHPPVGNAAEAHATIRAKAKELALTLNAVMPKTAGRELALAITATEQAMMWGCAGVARHSAPKTG